VKDVSIAGPFTPFLFETPIERIRTIAALWNYRKQNLPLPPALGILLGEATDEELRGYYAEMWVLSRPGCALNNREGLETVVKALDIVGFFHSLRCEGADDGPCLGQRIAAAIDIIKEEIDQFTP
jgi:hypothetical protein